MAAAERLKRIDDAQLDGSTKKIHKSKSSRIVSPSVYNEEYQWNGAFQKLEQAFILDQQQEIAKASLNHVIEQKKKAEEG